MSITTATRPFGRAARAAALLLIGAASLGTVPLASAQGKVALLLPGSINDQSWNASGYAAIAMDLSGSGKPHQPRTDAGPRQRDDVIFRTDGPATDQWSYHAVAAVIRAHS